MAAARVAKRCFVFGYGSLINAQSRKITMGSLTASSPAELLGYERQFCVRIHYRAERRAKTGAKGTSALGVVASTAASTNGVVFEVSPDQLGAIDAREGSQYRRVSVPADHIELLDDTGARLNDPSAAAALFGEQYEVWVYAAVRPCPPTRDYPLAQSYADIFVLGAMSVSAQFATAVVRTTGCWGAPASVHKPHAATGALYDGTHTGEGKVQVTPEAGGGGACGGGKREEGQRPAAGTPLPGGRHSKDGDLDLDRDAAAAGVGTWVDDRAAPVYSRALSPGEGARRGVEVDELLGRIVPQQLRLRTLFKPEPTAARAVRA